MKLSELKLNDANPRLIKDERFEKLKQSLNQFPKMLKLRPIVYDPVNMTILAGNMRYRALVELGFKNIPDEWARPADELSEEEKRRFLIIDNENFGTWDTDMIANEWEIEELKDWGFNNMPDMPDLDEQEGEFKAKYDIIVSCKTELELNELFYELKDRDFDVRVVGAKG